MQMPNVETILANKDNQEYLARVWRFAKIENYENVAAFTALQEHFKGFNSELSKKIGWTE